VPIFDRLTQAQRIVIVIALGVACIAVGIYVSSLGNQVRFGWYAYAPLSQAGPRDGVPGWFHLIIWLALTVAWASTSLYLLRPSRPVPPAA
jgi:heme/copper-type cytochrome/quinol oxidase subunit 1